MATGPSRFAMIEGFAPQNEVEAALAVQMACIHRVHAAGAKLLYNCAPMGVMRTRQRENRLGAVASAMVALAAILAACSRDLSVNNLTLTSKPNGLPKNSDWCWGQRFVGTAGPISAASHDVFRPDIGKSWQGCLLVSAILAAPWPNAASDSISEFPFR
jgi:hypothetical protein